LVNRTHIGRSRQDPSAKSFYLSHRLIKVSFVGHLVRNDIDLFTDINRDDIRSFFGQPDGMTSPLTACCTGD
jgi:hypothetical protein